LRNYEAAARFQCTPSYITGPLAQAWLQLARALAMLD
jgi:hypothetical protein